MSPHSDHDGVSRELPAHLAGNLADSAGQAWEGRSFTPNPAAGDDGSADPALWDALTGFRAGEGDQVAVVDALRRARARAARRREGR